MMAKKQGKHDHIMYLRDDGVGTTSTDGKHKHGLIYVPDQEPQIDPETQQIIEQGVPAHWEMEDVNDHVHEFADLKLEENKKKKVKDEVEKATRGRKLWHIADDIEKASRVKAFESEDFFEMNMWDDEIKAKLIKEKRACLSLPELKSKIDLLTGYFRRNKTDITYRPLEGGDQWVSEIYSFCIKYDLGGDVAHLEEVFAFEDECITGRGNMRIYIDTFDDLKGVIKLEKFPWQNVRYGPHNKIDASDMEYMLKDKWYSLAKLKQLHPKRAEEIDADFAKWQQDGSPDKLIPGKNYETPDSEAAVSGITTDFIDIAKQEYRLVELQEWEYDSVDILYNPNDDFYMTAKVCKYLKEKDRERIKSIFGFEEQTVKSRKMKVMTFAGDIVLETRYALLDDFDITPCYANKRRNSFWGKVEEGKDMNREVNKRHSQFSDILNKMASYIWFVDSQTFDTPRDKAKFNKDSGKPGFVGNIRNTDRPPVKQEGVRFPSELVNAEQFASQKMNENLNISPALLGQSESNETGFVFMRKQLASLMGNEYLYDNFSTAKKNIARKYLTLLRVVREPEDILRLINSLSTKKDPVIIGGKPIEEHDKKELATRLNLAQNEKYDIVVDESKSSPTKRMSDLSILLEMNSRQPGSVPPVLIIELLDLSQELKDKWLQSMQQQQEASAAESEKTGQVEITKTALANIKDIQEAQGGGQEQPGQPGQV